MYEHHVVGVFGSYEAAEQARSKLKSAGVSDQNIHLSQDTAGAPAEGRSEGFFDWLFGGGSPSRDRDWCHNNLTGGRTAVSVLVPENQDHAWLAEQLVEAGALDLEDESDQSIDADSIRNSRNQQGAQATQGSTEEVIPVAKEELEVGKHAIETRHRVRTRVVERPVEATVKLHDEKVVVERRPAAGADAAVGGFQDREYEVIERHEEPVAQKRARADEEVVIRKDESERTEQVRDKVRETKVEVEGNGDRGRTSPNPGA